MMDQDQAGPPTECLVRALHSLHPDDVDRVTQGLGALAGSWWVDQNTDYDGNLTIMASRTAEAPETYTIDRDATGVHVAVCTEAAYRRLGTYEDLGDAIAALVRHAGTAHEQT